jgi:glycosyltransferase involved in cell wall biosynthesis
MTGQLCKPSQRVCVVIPTYNNSDTVASVIRGAVQQVESVIVIDDGSTDATEQILRQFNNITVLRHSHNLGKGAALAKGLAFAAQKGFTHAVTIDADGQHLASDIPRFLAEIEKSPQALIIGVRDLSGRETRRRKSRILRRNSNFWVWVETGKWLSDTQSGFRAYPLAATDALLLKTRKYDYEIEVLVKLIWAGVDVAAVKVSARYGPGSRSHFRPLRDFLIVAHLSGCLIWQRILLPAALRRLLHLKTFHDKPFWKICSQVLRNVIMEEVDTPWGFAVCVGLGVCFGILPIWGLQMFVAAVVAHHLRLSKPLILVASNISFPAAIPFILYASLLLGRFVLSGQLDYDLGLSVLNPKDIWKYAIEYLVGSISLAVLAGAVTTVVSYFLARAYLLFRYN